MKGTIRIISGQMRGRVIPFSFSKFADAEITPQKVKGAVFSIIGENLSGKTFIDLYAGSGQMAIEALSRGSSFAVINEMDRKRFVFISDFIDKSGCRDKTILLNMNAKSALVILSERGVKGDIIFLDPPYIKGKGEVDAYPEILSELERSAILHDESVILVQHFTASELPDVCGLLKRIALKRYGTTSLSVYRQGIE